jgi:hypothetical protein
MFVFERCPNEPSRCSLVSFVAIVVTYYDLKMLGHSDTCCFDNPYKIVFYVG